MALNLFHLCDTEHFLSCITVINMPISFWVFRFLKRFIPPYECWQAYSEHLLNGTMHRWMGSFDIVLC